MSRARRRLGRRGEAKAARHLRRRGLRIIERNWRCRLGEVDILARDRDQLVIVEVRTQRGAGGSFAGGPLQTVGPRKRQKLIQLAHAWLRQSRWQPVGIRFDIVAVTRASAWRWTIDWRKNAFEG